MPRNCNEDVCFISLQAKFIALRSEQLKREYAAARQHAPPLVSPRHYEAAAASPRHIDPVKMFALKSGESIGIIDEAPPRARSQSLTAEYFWRQQRGHTMPGPREKGASDSLCIYSFLFNGNIALLYNRCLR